jgi:hypothetical protein
MVQRHGGEATPGLADDVMVNAATQQLAFVASH